MSQPHNTQEKKKKKSADIKERRGGGEAKNKAKPRNIRKNK